MTTQHIASSPKPERVLDIIEMFDFSIECALENSKPTILFTIDYLEPLSKIRRRIMRYLGILWLRNINLGKE